MDVEWEATFACSVAGYAKVITAVVGEIAAAISRGNTAGIAIAGCIRVAAVRVVGAGTGRVVCGAALAVHACRTAIAALRIRYAADGPGFDAASPVNIADGIGVAAVRGGVAGIMDLCISLRAAPPVKAGHAGPVVATVRSVLASAHARANAAAIIEARRILVAAIGAAEAFRPVDDAALPAFTGHSRA